MISSSSSSGSSGEDSTEEWSFGLNDFEDLGLEPLSADPLYTKPQLAVKHDQTYGWNTVRSALTSTFWKLIAAGSLATETSILACLAADESVRIRKRVAENQNAQAPVLDLLSDDASEVVRTAVAKNKNTPLYVLNHLAEDESTYVRFAIASNRHMPDAILLGLFLDQDPVVAERASQTLAA